MNVFRNYATISIGHLQKIRNELSAVEDEARKARNNAPECSDAAQAFDLIARLAQIVRQDIVE